MIQARLPKKLYLTRLLKNHNSIPLAVHILRERLAIVP
jgi:hypothetical protein